MRKFSSTTKGSYRRTSKTKPLIKIIVITVVLITLLLLIPRTVGFVGSVLFMPIHAVENWLAQSSNSLPQFFRDRTELLNEIDTLRSAPPDGAAAEMVIRRLERENAELRTLLRDNGADTILAGVAGRPSLTPYDILVLDKGSDDGVLVGAPVYVDDKTVIGTVVSVKSRSSVVELVTTPGYESTVYIYGPNIYTTAQGLGGGILKVSVPQGILLEVGNVVVLPAVLPGLFGEINSIESEPTQPEQFGFVTTNVPTQSLHYVSVGTRAVTDISFEAAALNVDTMRTELFTVPVPEGFLIDVAATSSATSTATTTDVAAEITTEEL